jgi:hypothetical protein
MDLSKLKCVYAIRNKVTGALYQTPNGKTSWSTKSAAKNAWNCHNYGDIHYTNYKGEPAVRRGNLRFDVHAKDLEVVEMAYIVAKGSDADNELQYLRWFYANADFGPADDDVRQIMNERYVHEGGVIPKGYENE